MRSAATASARRSIPTTRSASGPAGDDGDELVPVGKAYFGFTDEELLQIDRFVRRNTVERFGPVREVVHEADQGLVLEVAFEGLQRSTRHKSGVAMRFPRISRLRWDKPPRRSRPAGDAGEDAGADRAHPARPAARPNRATDARMMHDEHADRARPMATPSAAQPLLRRAAAAVIFRLILLSILVGVILKVLGLDPLNIIAQRRGPVRAIWDMGFDAIAVAVALFPARRRDRRSDLADRCARSCARRQGR